MQLTSMPSYAVLWKEEAHNEVHLGRAEFDAHGLALHGDSRARLYILDGELDGIERDGQTRVGVCEALRVTTRNGINLLMASVSGIGMLTELHEELAQRLLGSI
jgi:hypothetical protein